MSRNTPSTRAARIRKAAKHRAQTRRQIIRSREPRQGPPRHRKQDA